ncbi:DUF4135 domain-containing protein [Nakamurella sp.]|uniref:DUF4135 domain-containing protein n=1 Tax=Nakamurella sp. TaxID=1869182 RepID=UPI003B3ACADA
MTATPCVARITSAGADDHGAFGTAEARTDDVGRAELLATLARASSPAERIAGGWLRPSDDRTLGELRFARWSRRIADGRPDRAAAILAEHGFTQEQWRAGLGEVAVRPGEPLPGWARDALTLVDLIGTEPGPHRVPRLREVAGDGLPEWVDGDQPWRFHPGFRDWLTVAAREVDRWTGAAPIGAAARRDLVLDLARRQLGVAGPLLMQAAAGRPADDPLFAADPRGDWIALWTSHPVVARLLATVWRQWRETTAELCGRVATDLPSIRPGTRVTGFELSAGDQHGDGRSVARLRLSDGTSLFLKPRADRLHRLLGTVLTRVDRAGPPLGIDPARSLPRIVDKGGYAWVLEVAAAECSTGTVGAYFRRTGALLRVLQAMGATDLHHENFVPTDTGPVLVDLETVVSPGPLRTAPAADAVARRLSDTPGPTSMVSSVVSGAPGRETADIGALAGPSRTRTPYPVRVLVPTATGPELRSERAPMDNGNALPRVTGRPTSLRGHEPELIAGYAEAQRRLAALAVADLLPADGTGRDLAPSVRFVARPTRTYARLLLQSTAPAALVDGVERELVIELLYRAVGTAPAGLIACEAAAMRELDVPLFTIPFDRPDLISDRGVVLPDALTQAPTTRTQERLRALTARADHVDDLRATLFAMDPAHHGTRDAEPVRTGAGMGGPDTSTGGATDRPTGKVVTTPARRPSGAVDLTEPVATLLDRVIVSGTGAPAWVGLEHDPNRNRWTYGRLGAGLTGQAGIGLALATVTAGRPADRLGADCAAIARGALLGSVDRIGPGEIGPADAFTGPAGVLYAAAVAGRLLSDGELVDAARSLVGPSLVAARRDQPSFVVDAAAGAVLALLQLPPDDAVADALAELARLIDRPEPDGDLDIPDEWSRSLPSRAFGTALARHRLAAREPDGEQRPAPRFPDPTGTGDEVAAATVRSPAPPSDPVPADASLRVLLDRAALARAARRAGGDPAWATHLSAVRRALADRRLRTGRWTGPAIAPDATQISPVHGLAALAVLFAGATADLAPDLAPDVAPDLTLDVAPDVDVPIASALT